MNPIKCEMCQATPREPTMRFCRTCLKVVRAKVKQQIEEREPPIEGTKHNEMAGRTQLPWCSDPDTNMEGVRWQDEHDAT